MRKLILAVAMIGLIFLAACGSNEDSESTAKSAGDGKKYKVGASQYVEHPSLDNAYKGFQAALDEAGLDVEYDLQSAQNDQNNVKPISDGFVADKVDLIFANATPSALGALQATKEIPIVFTSVTDAVGAGLVPSMEEAGGNVTGVVDLHPDAIKETVKFMDANFPDAKVGMVYNAGEQNSVSQVDAVKAAAEGTSIQVVERTVANSAEVQQATTTLVSEVDLLYIITDNTVVSALESVVGVANEQDIPVIVGEPDSLGRGGFATFGIDYYTIGHRAGEMAVDILTGEKSVSDIPAEYPPEIQLFINKEAAEEQGVEWNDEWDETAKFVETAK
ncbi:ABC transporter substrate-binding protein [Oceanobacillus chungangensis]|uniref:BMP family ABC transporter substrate-binding protein n=1 Tax=Oceanobacillus chungangensis TaxID=1229152 RepID=A0A3D8PWC2_9BACI|nr:ABC transporter substrate-binding protein [Oceanobacillus chungangensis]RDW20426.1 BMP family ABC transporter substrate-binding protein [Oceanobacillus chungangensis]